MLQPFEDDRQLVSRYIAGDEKAFELLVRKHKDRVFGYIKMMVKDRQLAEDLYQEVFTKAIHTIKKGSYNEEGKFLPWIMRIAHNLVIDVFRKNKRMPTTSGGPDFDIFDIIKHDEPSVHEKMVVEQIHSDVRKLVELLPEDQKTVLKMRHYGEMSFKEIAEETNVSINTALGRMRYALINLRKLIEENQVNLMRH